MFRALLSGFLILSAFQLAACQKSSESASKEITTSETIEVLKKNSCFAKDDEGGPAVPGQRSVVLTHFGKAFDESHLAAVSGASARAIVDYAQTTGVEIFKIEGDFGGCRMLGFATPATSTMQELWDSISTGGGYLLGLFLPKNLSAFVGRTKPVILLRDDVSRHTLLHEYMHHLFNEEREAGGVFDGDVRDSEKRTGDALDAFGDPEKLLNDKKKVTEYSRSWLAYVREGLRPMLIHFSFEEITIEALLLERDGKGQLGKISDTDRRTGKAYILSKFDEANGRLETITQQGVALMKKAEENGDEELKSEFAKVLLSVAEDKATMVKLRRSYVRVSNALSKQVTGVAGTVPTETAPSEKRSGLSRKKVCGREKAVEAAIRRGMRRISQ